MDADFWLTRWQNGRTHFHQAHVMPLLTEHWSSLDIAPDARILVPLCGKSNDMLWLAEQGHRVVGVELSPLAVTQFFVDNHLQPVLHNSPAGIHYVAGAIEIICGDIFDLDTATLAGCSGIYDRAALIALPPEMRARYAAHIYGQLPPACKGLLVTLDYAQEEMSGPPFSVNDQEVQRLLAPHCTATIVERQDISEEFASRGPAHVDTVAYHLTY